MIHQVRRCAYVLILVVAAGGALSAWAAAPLPSPSEGGSADSQLGPLSQAIFPGEDIQARVNAAPPGTTFLLTSGVHRMQSIVPRSGDVFVGQQGTLLSGARLLTAVRSGSYWVVPNQTQEGVQLGSPADGVCRSGAPRCGYPQDLFVDDVPLAHVSAFSDLGPGKWYFDYRANQIYLLDDPTGKRLETSVTAKAFQGSATRVTIRNLTIEKYASPTQEAAIELGPEWVIEGCEVRWNHFSGIGSGPRSIARRNHVHHNGALGFQGAGEDILVADNEIAYNGFAGYNHYWGAGGSKWVYTTNLIVRGNFAHHNHGPGLWTDINNIYTLYENNIAEDNFRSGIYHEISYDAIIRNNTLRRNGTEHAYPWWTTGGGIEVTSSRNVEIYGNTLEHNWQGITALDDHRGTGIHGPWTLINLNVHDNTVISGIIAAGGGRTGVADSAGTASFSSTANNRFQRNIYVLGTTLRYFIWMGRELSEHEWQSFGQDTTGTFQR